MIEGSDDVVPSSCSWVEFDPVRFIINLRIARPSSNFVGFCTPNSPFSTGVFPTLYTLSRSIHSQILRSISSCAIPTLSESLIWILPGILGNTTSDSFFRTSLGFRRNLRVRWPTQSAASILPPCSLRGSEGRTWSSVSSKHLAISSPP